MSAQNWLGLALGIGGAFGMWVSGSGRWQGWAVGLAIQPVWVAFFLIVGSYTALAVPALYGSVYARNLWRWRTEAKANAAADSQRLARERLSAELCESGLHLTGGGCCAARAAS